MVQKNKTGYQVTDIKRLEFHISYSCSNSCLFCSEADQMKTFKDRFVGKDVILRHLRLSADKGMKHLTLTGGEPTLHPDFIDIVTDAKHLGFIVYVSSNGGKFSSSEFCRRALPYLDEISFSLHGPNAKIHNMHTRNNKSFSLLMRSLQNIERSQFSPALFINSVVTLYNVDVLEQNLRMIAPFKKIKQVLISNIAPEGRAKERFDKLVVPLDRLRNKVNKLVRIAQDNSVLIRFFGMPLCSLGSRPDVSNDLHWSPRLTLELRKTAHKTILKKTISLKPDRNRKKSRICRRCSCNAVCSGVFDLYLSRFGDEGIKLCAQ